jgi:hypothetical protein
LRFFSFAGAHWKTSSKAKVAQHGEKQGLDHCFIISVYQFHLHTVGKMKKQEFAFFLTLLDHTGRPVPGPKSLSRGKSHGFEEGAC